MNWDAISAIGELIGASAVFVSVIYLAVQIRNSKRSDQIIAASQAALAVDEWIGQIVRDSVLHDVYRRGLIGYDTLSREEKSRFALLIVQFLRSTEVIWLHRQLDTIDSDYWSSVESTIERIVGSTGGIRSFERNRAFFSAGFVCRVEEIISRGQHRQGEAGR